MGHRIQNEPVYVSGARLQDIWVDGIQCIETVTTGVYRIPLFRRRGTSDGIAYREPVVQLLCARASIPEGIRQIWDALTGRGDFNPKMLS